MPRSPSSASTWGRVTRRATAASWHTAPETRPRERTGGPPIRGGSVTFAAPAGSVPRRAGGVDDDRSGAERGRDREDADAGLGAGEGSHRRGGRRRREG